ncbi:MAG: tetratricopeptide repeat protein [Candidatus Eisenbacteria bacterium]
MATRALALSRTQEEIEPSVLTTLASICESRGELDDARRHLREALTLPKMSTMLSGKVVALSNLGVLEAGEGRLEEARALYESAYELAEQLHDLPSLAGVAANIAITRLEQGDAAGARPFAESSLREAKKSGSGVLLVMARRAAVLVALAHEERAEARALVVDVLDALENETRIESWDMAFDTILDYLEAVGSHEAAVGILATAEELYQSTGHHKQPAFRARRTDRTERLRASIGPERFATLLASGRSLSRQQAAVAARAAI